MGIIISELGLIGFVETESRCFLRGRRNSTGGERSFSTLCFALALHEMTQAPFRVMDEFDVFMDALSRKISLDTLVDFALAQDSKWIFIMPHDISLILESLNDLRINRFALSFGPMVERRWILLDW
ncbi:structural maintenance of chromosomes protein 6B-like isoform X3 [Benincasa hispida]|uniref:structural maintenance of chromosomes protein 6B-like isoform X3 n=1 Tax=Benincasa hispida TaxID=102211 RepID=UPI001901D788|nr:structural maintenance of chromosomes protein 6B-like isoform X3 [Benincasa hispida]